MKVPATVGELSRSSNYIHKLALIKSALSSGSEISRSKENLEQEPEYQLVIDSNILLQDIDEEIILTHRYVCDLYHKKFPELEGLIPNKIDYNKTVKLIGNEMDLTMVNGLKGILANNLVMIVSVTASTTSGEKLSDGELADCFKGCDEVLALDEDKKLILEFVESRMSHIAPNLCALIGSSVAAQLVGLAGGLTALSKIPSCNVQVMGQDRTRNVGFGLSNIAAQLHTGVLQQCELIQSCVPILRKKALKIVAGKVALAARMDSYQTDFDDAGGSKLHIEIEEKLNKLQEPMKARTKKALPIPEEQKRSKRGGKRVRKMKERFAVTDMQKKQNQMGFSITGGEYGDSAMGEDNGMLGSKDSGRIRAPQAKESKVVVKKQKKVVSVSSGNSNGLSSSLVFTPVQGLELVNPNAAADRVKEANNKWFNNQSGFISAAPK